MPRINLLPWREELRKQRQKQFLIALGAAVVVAGLGVAGANLVFQSRIDHQNERNQRLSREIAELDKSIERIDGIERQKERLLARMEIIEQLQRSRPEVVHLFDELVRTLPDGVFLTAVQQNGRTVKVDGVAQSSTRVSSLMRNIDSSEWIGNPDLEKIQTVDRGRTGERFNFTLNAKQRSASASEEGVQ